VVPTDQKSDSHRYNRGAEQSRFAVVALSIAISRVSIIGANKTFRYDKNPATGSVRTNGRRNLPTFSGLSILPRQGDSGKSLSAEVRQATAVWTHTNLHSSCQTSCRAIGERFGPMVPPADRHYIPYARCVWGTPIGYLAPELMRRADRPSAALLRQTTWATPLVPHDYPTYLARGVRRLSALTLQRERPSR
jgi:hypothetical protein